ncbi:MAG: peptide chain release factor N(5)-glutamine methyltransferase [bacterium]|nr:peptide chain release factor N(5)-glutamine methyltransferase [bacterium]
MTIGDIYKEVLELFRDKFSNSYLEAILIISLGLGKSKEYILAHQEVELSEKEIAKIKGLVEKRLAGVPYAYLKKEKEFFGINFFIDEGVLIPRPETETIVEIVLEEGPFVNGLDLFCGSGIIGLTILCKEACQRFIGIDISSKSIEVATINAEKLGLLERVNFLKADIRSLALEEDFDLIVANPPYLPVSAWDSLPQEVRQEPKEALLGGDDGLIFYPEIAKIITKNLVKGGLFAVEIGKKEQVDRVKEIFLSYNIKDVRVKEDLSGLPRVIWGRK